MYNNLWFIRNAYTLTSFLKQTCKSGWGLISLEKKLWDIAFWIKVVKPSSCPQLYMFVDMIKKKKVSTADSFLKMLTLVFVVCGTPIPLLFYCIVSAIWRLFFKTENFRSPILFFFLRNYMERSIILND